MRLIQATVPPDARQAVREALDDHGVDYFSTHETSTDEYDEVLYFSTPEAKVEPVLQDLYASGLGGDDHVVIINTEVDIFEHAEKQQDNSQGYERIASAELEGHTADLLPDYRTFVTMMVLSTIVATTGVLLDSAAVVVGSMVLAPLFGPAVSTSVGTVIDRSKLFWRGVTFQVLGVSIAVVSAVGFAWVMRNAYLLPSDFVVTAAPQVVKRLSPDLLSLVVALVAGTAGVISIATDAGRTLVGVMMAAALLPPAAVVGIGIVWQEPAVAFRSGILLLVNVLAINFAGLVTLWYLGYRPQSWIQVPQTRRSLLKRGGVLLVAILLISAFLGSTTYANAQRAQMQSAIEQDVAKLLDAEKYANVTVVDVRVVRDRSTLLHRTEKVVVTLGRPPDERHPQLHREIDRSIEKRVGSDVPVDIRVSLVISA